MDGLRWESGKRLGIDGAGGLTVVGVKAQEAHYALYTHNKTTVSLTLLFIHSSSSP